MKTFTALVPLSLFPLLSACSVTPGDETNESVDELTGAHAVDVQVRPNLDHLYPGDTKCWALSETFDVTLRNASIPWGAKVYLRYGEESGVNCSDCSETRSFSRWQDVREVEMSTSASWEWKAQVDARDGGGSAGEWLEALNFAFRIAMPDGTTVWDKGSDSPLAYYRARTGQTGGVTSLTATGPCPVQPSTTAPVTRE